MARRHWPHRPSVAPGLESEIDESDKKTRVLRDELDKIEVRAAAPTRWWPGRDPRVAR